jgi:alpha-L-rhamnosidase
VGTARPQYHGTQELGTSRPHPEDVNMMQPRPFLQPSPSGRGNAERQLSSLPTVSSPLTNGPEPSITVYDLGQNAALMPRITVRGPAGARVRIIPAELLAKDGTVDRGSCAGGKPGYWEYVLAGKGKETWFPKFFYQGCRYLQVECKPAPGQTSNPPRIESLEGVVVHADSPPAGEFQCSNDLFNRIRRLVRWAQRSNMMSVMTDCPHREKLGWLEEDHLNGPALRYEFDLARLTGKMMNDMADAQAENGLVPDTAPEYVRFSGGFRDSPEWGSACILVPWQQYEFTGDINLLRTHYDGMRRYAAYLGSRATNGIVSHGLGDWYDIGPKAPGVAQLTPVPLTATAFYYCDASILSRVAALLDEPQEATNYDALASRIRSAFNERFFNPSNNTYATGSQCANALALALNLAEPANRPALVEALVKDVRARGNALTAGDVGYRYLLLALAEAGRSDVVFDMNNQSDKPGYGYQIKQGATSLTEAWNARRSSSQNHFMLGQITEWLYHDLAGIGSDPAGPGFKKIIINPAPVGNLKWVKARYNSIHGAIVSDWKRDGSRFTLEVTLPANTTATVIVPAQSAHDVMVDGAVAEGVPGVRFLRQQGDRAIFEVVSGHYVFRSFF